MLKSMNGRVIVIGVAAVLTLTGGCVSKAGESSVAGTTTTSATTTTSTTSTTTTPRPTDVTADPTIAVEAAEIIASGDAERFNKRICPGTHHIQPVTTIGADFANTQPGGVGTYDLIDESDVVIARLNVSPGQDLMLILGLDFETYQWCAYSIEWCPLGFLGLSPLTVTEEEVVRELHQRALCGR